MQTIEEPIETIHLYVVREPEKQPYSLLPLFCAFLCVVAIAAFTLWSGQNPAYAYGQVRVPAELLPMRTFTASVVVIPTGIKTYPATIAHGVLTITNGSILSEVLPADIIFSGTNGAEVQTTESAFIPAGSAAGYGVATVQARGILGGKRGDISPLTINAVYGTSMYIRNLRSFSGGRDAYSVKFITAEDKQRALDKARAVKEILTPGLHYPCEEFLRTSVKISVTWRCQFVTFKVPPYTHVVSARLSGKEFVLDVAFIAPPRLIWAK